ncbi:MAG: alpha-ketoglutarate-dependent dioxygenase AlkB family protein [Actinomycetes bacterium]
MHTQPTLTDLPATTMPLSPTSWVLHVPGWLPDPDQALTAVLAELAWVQEPVVMFGQPSRAPRLTAVAGEWMTPASRYRTPCSPAPWTPSTARIRDAVAAMLPGWDPNGLIANWYRDGQDSIGWHADDEPRLGRNPVVASVSLGASRVFRFRRGTSGPTVVTVPLGHGDLCIMGGATQTEFQHAIHKTRSDPGARVSLTFRHYLPTVT